MTDGAAESHAPPFSSQPRRRIIRWSGLIPLALALALFAAGWLVLGERIIRENLEEAATKLLGSEVNVAALDIRAGDAVLDIRGIEIADPFDPARNLVAADQISAALDPRALLERKIVVDRLSVRGVRTGGRRAHRARLVKGGGFAPRALREMAKWRSQFDVPLLKLTPLDTIKSIVLDPKQLATVREALALAARADSVKGAVQRGYDGLRLRETLDSSEAVARRLKEANPRKLGLAGTRQAVEDVKRTARQIDSARQHVLELERTVQSSGDMLAAGVRGLDSTRKQDYAFARGLLKPPTFEGPAISSALFGQVSLDRLQQLVYWATLAERYIPPGMRPREEPGPKRLRAAGTTVRFPKAREYPPFHVRTADLTMAVGDGAARGAYTARVLDVTTTPVLVGKPTVFAARREAAGTKLEALRVHGTLDHLGAVPRDAVTAAAAGVALPALDLPGLPFRAELGTGTGELRFVREGDRIAARWAMHADRVTWSRDATKAPTLSDMQDLVWRVLGGLHELRVAAELNGPLAKPTLTVTSNLDEAIAQRLRAVAGEEVKRAESMARAKVDSIAAEKTAPVRARVDSVRADGERRVAEAKQRLDDAKRRLEAEKARRERELKDLKQLPIPLPRRPSR